MHELFFRTENIKPEDLQRLIVTSKLEDEIIEALKSNSNIILEGSRGVGNLF